MTQITGNPIQKTPTETIIFGWDMTHHGLATGETISSVGTPVQTKDGASTTDLVIDDEAPNAATFKNAAGGTVAIGNGVQAEIAGGTAGDDYLVRIPCTTSAGQILDAVGLIQVRSS